MMEEFLSYTVYGFYGMPLLAGTLRWRQLSGDQRLVVAWCAFVIPFSLISEYIGRRYGNNLPLYHLYTFAEFFFLFHLLRKEWKQFPIPARLLPVLLFVIVGIWGFVQDRFAFPDRVRSVESLILIGCALRFFYRSIRLLEVERIERTFSFWISVGILLYFTGNLLLYVFSNYIAHRSDEVYFSIWTIHTLLVILLYLLYTIALLCKDPTRQSSQSSLSVR